MKILIATDSFKDALDALSVGKAIEKGIKSANPAIQTNVFPLADGGEGTASILTYHSKGKTHQIEVNNPVFKPTIAQYGISRDGETAFMEMAQASGLQLLSDGERNPLKTTTFGTGELIKDALQKGVNHFLLGIGGSATNDAGIGMAAALGYRFLDENGKELPPIGENLIAISKIDDSNVLFDKNDIRVEVICDVTNPLFGKKGAAHIYAAQKGANESAIIQLDKGLRHFSKVLTQHFKRDFANIPGAGAAGGLGAAAMVFLNATLRNGIETIMDYTQIDEHIKEADLIITGEGKIDSQTLDGKLIQGIAQRASQFDVPVIALCGSLLASPAEIKKIGLKGAFSIINRPLLLQDAIAETACLLENAAFNVISSTAI